MALLGLVTPEASADTPTDPLTVQDYASYLAEEAPAEYANFSSLPSAQQERLVEILYDPRLYTNPQAIPEYIEESTTTTTPAAVEPFAVRPGTYVKQSDNKGNIFGVNIVHYRARLGWKVTTTTTTINFSEGYVVTNLNPLVTTGLETKSAWVTTAGTACVDLVFHWKLQIGSGSYQLGSIYGYVRGDRSGGSTAWWN